MDYADAKRIADKLNAATTAGELASAYALVGPLTKEDAQAVMLAAGHSMIFARHRRECLAYAQASIAGACHARLDGWQYIKQRQKLTT